MSYVVTDSTDGQYVGQEIEPDDLVVILDDDVIMSFDRVMPLPDGMRFISSNYILDVREV